MLRETDRDRLRELIREIMETSLPVMCHDALGIPSISAIDELRGELHDALETEMALCAQRRNARLPVHALPADVLRCIAAHSAFNTRADAALVCAHWRTALVGDRRLWRDAVFFWNGYGAVDATSAAAVVHRAGGALESLAVQSPHELLGDPLVVPLVTSVLGALRSLTVDLVPADEGAWAQIFAHPAPALQTLRVIRYALASVYVLPQTLFAGVAPQLRTVLLHCCVTPAAPCAAFAGVTTLGYFRFAKLTGGEVANALALAPRLARLVAGSWGYETAADVGGWALGAAFRELCVQKVVSDGVFDALARRARRVVVHEPLPLYADALVLRAHPLARVAVYWLGAGDRLSVAIASDSEAGAEYVVARVAEGFVLAFVRRHLDDMRAVTRVVFPDSVWLELCALPAPAVWPAVVSLTLYLALSGPLGAQYTHAFVLQDAPLAQVCPKLESVHLVHAGCRGNAAGEFLRVSAEHVARWLPAGVRCLRISGIVLCEPGLGVLRAKVGAWAVVDERPEEPYSVEDEEEWEWTFPFDDALQV